MQPTRKRMVLSSAMLDTRGPWIAGTIYGVAMLAFGVVTLTAPMPVLLDRFVPDDAFYYFRTAREFVTSGRSTFDGLHITTGYQPLWFLASAVVNLVFTQGGELPVRAMLSLQLLSAVGATALMATAVARATNVVIAMVTGVLWVAVFQRPASVNGLETGVHCLLFAMLFAQFIKFQRADPAGRVREAFALGVTAALFFLARVDGVLILMPIALWFTLAWRRHGHRKELVAFVVPISVVAAAYFILNLVATGHATPISGAAKLYHSSLARNAQIMAGESARSVYLANLMWPWHDGAWWAVACLGAPVCAWMLRLFPTRRRIDPRRPATWPFAVGVWVVFLFYGVAFYGSFSRTIWYYGPLVMVGWYYLAVVSNMVSRLRLHWLPFRVSPLLAPFLAVGGALLWLRTAETSAAIVSAVLVAFLARRVRSPLVARFAPVIATIVVGSLVVLSIAGGFSLREWALVTAVSTALGSLVIRPRFSPLGAAYVTLAIVLPSMAVHGANLINDLKSTPSQWNYHLYQGALWARRSLPPDVTIWSGSAGILGYFSERRVVNTDGLANDWSFLNDVLRSGEVPFGTYIARWDYAIDAMTDESLEQFFPEGCFLTLPPGVVPGPFNDGGATRSLRVYQMRPVGVVDCSDQ
jgi:hypothetical protein